MNTPFFVSSLEDANSSHSLGVTTGLGFGPGTGPSIGTIGTSPVCSILSHSPVFDQVFLTSNPSEAGVPQANKPVSIRQASSSRALECMSELQVLFSKSKPVSMDMDTLKCCHGMIQELRGIIDNGNLKKTQKKDIQAFLDAHADHVIVIEDFFSAPSDVRDYLECIFLDDEHTVDIRSDHVDKQTLVHTMSLASKLKGVKKELKDKFGFEFSAGSIFEQIEQRAQKKGKEYVRTVEDFIRLWTKKYSLGVEQSMSEQEMFQVLNYPNILNRYRSVFLAASESTLSDYPKDHIIRILMQYVHHELLSASYMDFPPEKLKKLSRMVQEIDCMAQNASPRRKGEVRKFLLENGRFIKLINEQKRLDSFLADFSSVEESLSSLEQANPSYLFLSKESFLAYFEKLRDIKCSIDKSTFLTRSITRPVLHSASLRVNRKLYQIISRLLGNKGDGAFECQDGACFLLSPASRLLSQSWNTLIDRVRDLRATDKHKDVEGIAVCGARAKIDTLSFDQKTKEFQNISFGFISLCRSHNDTLLQFIKVAKSYVASILYDRELHDFLSGAHSDASDANAKLVLGVRLQNGIARVSETLRFLEHNLVAFIEKENMEGNIAFRSLYERIQVIQTTLKNHADQIQAAANPDLLGFSSVVSSSVDHILLAG